MQSKLLQQHGLEHFIAGSDYNFRTKTMGEGISGEYQRAIANLSTQPEHIYSGTQVHGSNVEYASGQSGSDALFSIGKHFEGTDGLVTDKASVALVIKYADCTPIVIFDPVKKVQASVHSGWRGTVKRIGNEAVKKMVTDFGSDIKDLVIYLGPSIDQGNYEVGAEVYEAFSDFKTRDLYFQPQGEKYLLSNIDAVYHSLLELGLKEEQIEKAEESTFTDSRLHSARAEGVEYGLNAIVTMIK